MEADSLSKVDIQMGFGQWMISEDKNGEHYEYYHIPFIEDLPPTDITP
jgi:hypothetical protein